MLLCCRSMVIVSIYLGSCVYYYVCVLWLFSAISCLIADYVFASCMHAIAFMYTTYVLLYVAYCIRYLLC